ncbi:DNA topoisomerase (ATP-hydrolyzing) subunit A [Faecalispora jeddahensis]|uniref:DNA gyrase/topoisomerase IV subunit A n=1 Tax=Faecalispora jeddahensis TaxID=1414721 RepID=UPI00145BCF50|nr:DNA topoisomerase (ATP-hydrolyzing) subunit A [Faecalispora jeddahensis]MDU6347755.1 DNA topoisomerase (ATP-hydrolyzing) subunit A [Clostridium sp.]
MAHRKKEPNTAPPKGKGVIEGAGLVVTQPITATLEQNYMPYAMSVIMSRAIPEIDGFKPSHRKILYTMYKMGLLTGSRTKSANIVGQTMKLNPHGDAAIYETMVRLSRGYEALLHPYVDSKGNFGKFYSRDMAWAASRYTEAKLDDICQELFRDIDRDTVDFVDNYDNSMKEPTLLPAAFPSILVNANTGIAVGMASNICPFNLAEVCQTTIALIRDPDFDVASTLQAPDFPGGGQAVYDRAAMEEIYRTGRGGVKIRCRYSYDKTANCIDVTQIPPTTTIEAIVEKVVDLVRQGKLKEISDIRDETGLGGLKITIDLKRGVDPERLMQRLFKMTPLEDSFSCNFNVLISGVPQVLGVRDLLLEWVAFRVECVRRRTHFDLRKKKEKLHLLRGLQAILLDIDKAIKIVRETEEEAEVVPNLMIGFGIDEIQAEYVAEIKLRHLNREYILKRTQETSELEQEIARLQELMESRAKIQSVIIAELKEVEKKYGQPRRTQLVYASDLEVAEPEQEIDDYPVHLFFTREGYFKKITPQSLRMSGEQKLKEGDAVTQTEEATNACDLLFFTDRCQVYKMRASDLSDGKASVLGEYIPAKAGMDEGENAIYMVPTTDYQGYMLFLFENGKAAKVELSAYATKTNRRKLVGAYSDKSPLVAVMYLKEDRDLVLTGTNGRLLLVNTGAIPDKATRTTQGVFVMTFTAAKHHLQNAEPYEEGMLETPDRYRKNVPSPGAVPSQADAMRGQLSLT